MEKKWSKILVRESEIIFHSSTVEFYIPFNPSFKKEGKSEQVGATSTVPISQACQASVSCQIM